MFLLQYLLLHFLGWAFIYVTVPVSAECAKPRLDRRVDLEVLEVGAVVRETLAARGALVAARREKRFFFVKSCCDWESNVFIQKEIQLSKKSLKTVQVSKMHLFCTLHPGPLLVREQDVPVEPGGVP